MAASVARKRRRDGQKIFPREWERHPIADRRRGAAENAGTAASAEKACRGRDAAGVFTGERSDLYEKEGT